MNVQPGVGKIIFTEFNYVVLWQRFADYDKQINEFCDMNFATAAQAVSCNDGAGLLLPALSEYAVCMDKKEIERISLFTFYFSATGFLQIPSLPAIL